MINYVVKPPSDGDLRERGDFVAFVASNSLDKLIVYSSFASPSSSVQT